MQSPVDRNTNSVTRPLVLIVEDSRTCSSHLAARLRAEPHRAHVVTCSTVHDARTWLIANKQSITLVVLDVTLPDGNGLVLLPLFAQTPVVVVSGSLVELPVRGATMFVHKGSGWVTCIEAILARICRSS